jgi:hypothetical protein
MKYALVIKMPASAAREHNEAEEAAIHHECDALTRDAREAGRYFGSMRLEPSGAVASVRVEGHRAVVTDGPFAETKEFLAGIYVVDCQSVEQAIAYAQRHPGAKRGRIEVVPLMGFDPG